MKRIAPSLFVLLAGCVHTSISVNSGTSLAPPPTSGTHVVSSGAGLQVNASGRAATAIVAAGVVAATVQDLRDPEPMPRYRSLSDWFWGRPAPQMDPTRTVNEQDCTKPIEGAGNLKCR